MSTDELQPQDNVKVHAPDRSLQAKIGNVSLDQILSPKTVAAAQNTIIQAADQFAVECMSHMEELETSCALLYKADNSVPQLLHKIIACAFFPQIKIRTRGI
jgi:hypothetical protein